MTPPRVVALIAALALAPALARPADAAEPDTMTFAPAAADSEASADTILVEFDDGTDEWLRAPYGDALLMEPGEWSDRGRGTVHVAVPMAYNRVDSYRLGVGAQWQVLWTMWPRVGARIEYAFQRQRTLWGLQVEQPILRRGRLSIGAQSLRVTDALDLQQVGELENSLAMALGRVDYRDYYEREGWGFYVASRFPGQTTLSLHGRVDEWRSLETRGGTGSLFFRDRELRDNPPVDPGETRRWILRLERAAHRTSSTRAGVYHWLEVEGAGGSGDFTYTRLLADVRSVLRLSPATTLAIRLVAGSTLDGTLPAQREFTVGGVDGLRAHRISQFRGNQVALGQAEYSIGLWRLRATPFEGGLHAIAFVDAGHAWSNPDAAWDATGQHFAVDGGLGLATAEDNLRIYFARNLQDADADVMISVRLQRPF